MTISELKDKTLEMLENDHFIISDINTDAISLKSDTYTLDYIITNKMSRLNITNIATKKHFTVLMLGSSEVDRNIGDAIIKLAAVTSIVTDFE